MPKEREFGFDNLRGLLMILVVFGHLLTVCGPFPKAGFLYRTIYSFHMPAFLFLTGYFARFDGKKLLRRLALPLVVFQILWLPFDAWFTGTPVQWQFITPHWILWYLLAAIYYHLLLPVYALPAEKWRLPVIGLTAALSLLIGYDSNIGYGFSLSRFFVFQPWFLLGWYSAQGDWISKTARWCKTRKIPIGWILTAAVCLMTLAIEIIQLSPEILYGAHPYAALDYGPLERGVAGVTALAWIGFGCLVLLPLVGRKLPLLTALGQNTMPVYLLHGFAVRWIQKCCPDLLATPVSVLAVLALILAAFGNPWVGRLFRRIFYGK